MSYPDEDNVCDGCGGGIDGDHPRTCGACRFERATGAGYERAVNAAHAAGLTLAQYAERRWPHLVAKAGAA